MPAIIPIPAFSDNYIWLVREGRHAVVVDPGDAAPVLDYLAREGLDARRDPRHASPRRSRRRHRGAARALSGARCSARRARRFPGARTRSREGDAITRPRTRARRFACSTCRATRRGTSRTSGEDRRTPVAFVGDTLFAGGCGRLFEGTPAQMAASLAKLAALPGETRVYCAHEYTLANLRFALAVEPGNAALRERQRARAGQARSRACRRCRRRSPTSARPIRSCAPASRRSSPRRRRTPGARSPMPSTRSPSCASGRTDFAEADRIAPARHASLPSPLAALLAACATPTPRRRRHSPVAEVVARRRRPSRVAAALPAPRRHVVARIRFADPPPRRGARAAAAAGRRPVGAHPQGLRDARPRRPARREMGAVVRRRAPTTSRG